MSDEITPTEETTEQTLEERVTALETQLDNTLTTLDALSTSVSQLESQTKYALKYAGSKIDELLTAAEKLESVSKISDITDKIKHLITTTGARVDKLGRMRKDFTVSKDNLSYIDIKIFDEGVKNDTSKCPVIADYINNYMDGKYTTGNIETALSRLRLVPAFRANEQSNVGASLPRYCLVTYRTSKNIYVQVRQATGGYLTKGNYHLDCILFMP